jgi:hypothetical protein
MRLYELPAAFRQVDDVIAEMGGELSPELEQYLDSLVATLEDKTDNICALIRERNAQGDALKAEADFFAAKARAAHNVAERLKDYLKTNLEKAGRLRMAGTRFTARVQKNGVPTITWTGAGDPPDEFCRVMIELDGKSVQESYRSKGWLPEGFSVVHGTHLRIA